MNGNSENTSMILVMIVFNGENYLPWSKSIQRALMAKDKLDFILKDNGSPVEALQEYQVWSKKDCLVTLWLLSSLSKEFSEAFLYAINARSLWKELEGKFGLGYSN